MLNPVTEGPERSRRRRRTPAPAPVPTPHQPSQSPPMVPPVQARPREWVIIARGDFPKGQPHRDNKFVRPNPPLHDGEEQLKYRIPFLPQPEVGPYEILDEHIIRSPMPERYINAKPELPNSELHEDALKVVEDTSYEKVVRVWVESESAGGSRKAVFIRVEHVRRLPRIEGWQVVKKSGGGALTRYMVMVAPDIAGQTPPSWVWMTVPELREQLPERWDELVQEYREYNPYLLQAEAEAEEKSWKEKAPARLMRRQEGQQIEATLGKYSTTKTDEDEGEATEIESDEYEQPPSPKRQRRSPVASYRVADISPQVPPAARSSSPVPSLPKNIFRTDFLCDQGESSSSLSNMASNRPQRVSGPESRPLDELEQSSPPTGPSFTPINFDPPTPTPGRRDSSQLQPLGGYEPLHPFVVPRELTPSLSPRSLGLELGASINKGEVDIDDLDLFPDPQPARCPPDTSPAPKVGDLELDDLDLDLELDRAIHPRQSLAYTAPGATTTNLPSRHSPPVPTSLTADSPLSTLRPSPSPPPPAPTRAPPVEPAPLRLESPLWSDSSPSPPPLPCGSVYLQPVADGLPVRRSARLGARGQAAVPEVLMKPLAKERLVKAKEKSVPVPTPSNSAAPAKRGINRLATATAPRRVVQALPEAAAGGSEPVPKRGHGRPKGSVGKKKVAPGRAGAGAEAEIPAAVGDHGQRGRKDQPEIARGVKGKGTKKGRGKK